MLKIRDILQLSDWREFPSKNHSIFIKMGECIEHVHTGRLHTKIKTFSKNPILMPVQ